MSLSYSHSIWSSKVTPLTNLTEVTVQRLCYCNSNAWGSHNSYQSGVIGIIDQLILQNRKSSEVYTINNNWPKTQQCNTHDTTLTSLLRQPSTRTCCHRFDIGTMSKHTILNHLQYWQSRVHREFPDHCPDNIIACLKSICTMLASCRLSNALCSAWDTHKSPHMQVPINFL